MDLAELIQIDSEITNEIRRQDAKWGDQRHLASTLWMTILMEEVGEVAKEVLEKDKEKAREELIQVAALCAQMINAIDHNKFNS